MVGGGGGGGGGGGKGCRRMMEKIMYAPSTLKRKNMLLLGTSLSKIASYESGGNYFHVRVISLVFIFPWEQSLSF